MRLLPSSTPPIVALAIAPDDAEAFEGSSSRPLVDVFLSRYGSDRSRAAMLDSLDRLAALLKKPNAREVDWTKVDLAVALAVRAELQRLYAPATINLTLSGLRGVLETAWQLGRLPHESYLRTTSGIRGVPGTRLPKGRALSDDEIARLKGLCEGELSFDIMLRALFAVMLGGGLRREEVCRLSVEAFRPPRTLVLIGKGNKERSVPLPHGAATELQAWIDVRKTVKTSLGWMFVRLMRDGRMRDAPFSIHGLYNLVRRCSEEAKIEPLVSPHDLRRTYATRMLDRGADLLTVQRLLAHSDPATTARYDRRAEVEAERAVDAADIY